MPRVTRPQVYRVVREMLPRERFGPDELLRWLVGTQQRNEQASRSHERRRRASQRIPPVTGRCDTSITTTGYRYAPRFWPLPNVSDAQTMTVLPPP